MGTKPKKVGAKPNKGGAKPKFDYEDPRFYKVIEEFAQKGMTDKNIAWALVTEFGENVNAQNFSSFKNEKDEKGEYTERAQRIREALARGRGKINLLVRDTFLKTALGGKKIKTVLKRYVERTCSCLGEDEDCPLCGGLGKVLVTDKAVMQETETELPPSSQALSTWLFNNDEEWRKSVIEGKKLDITTKGEEINRGFIVEVIDKREQVEKDTDDTGL